MERVEAALEESEREREAVIEVKPHSDVSPPRRDVSLNMVYLMEGVSLLYAKRSERFRPSKDVALSLLSIMWPLSLV